MWAIERLDVGGQVEAGRLAVLGRDVADVQPRRAGAPATASRIAGIEQARQEARVQAARARARSAPPRRSRRARRPRRGRRRASPRPARSRAVRMIRDWPSTTEPSRSRRGGSAASPRPARPGRGRRGSGSSRRTPSSKSPPSIAVIAASSRLPTAWPARPGRRRRRRRPSAAGKRYWRSSLISGSASARAAMQLRMSPTGGIPSSVAQHAGRAAVVGDGHDRGQVAGVLLEAAQQRRQAGPAADRHDPRAAGEEPLLVDDLDERLVRVRRAERVGQRRGSTRYAPNATSADADRRRRSARAAGTAGTGASAASMSAPASPPGSRSRVDLAQEVGERRGPAAAGRRTRRAASA